MSGIDIGKLLEGQPLLIVVLLGVSYLLWGALQLAQRERIAEGREAVKAIEANTAALHALTVSMERRREGA